jgi:hypothetical protein
MIFRRLSASMNQGAMILGLVALNGAAVYADDVPASASSTEQAQARQFGIYFGGMASQYDLCVKKGFLPKGDQSAEQTAKAILEKMRQFDKETDQSAFVHPLHSRWYASLAVDFYALNRLEGAEGAIRRAIELQPALFGSTVRC